LNLIINIVLLYSGLLTPTACLRCF